MVDGGSGRASGSDDGGGSGGGGGSSSGLVVVVVEIKLMVVDRASPNSSVIYYTSLRGDVRPLAGWLAGVHAFFWCVVPSRAFFHRTG